MGIADKIVQRELEYRNLTQKSLDTIEILQVIDNKVIVRVPANDKKKTASICSINIERLMAAAIGVKNGQTLTDLAKAFGIKRTSLAEDLNKKLPYIKDIYKISEQTAKK